MRHALIQGRIIAIQINQRAEGTNKGENHKVKG